MPDLSFQIAGVRADLDAAAPQMTFTLDVANADPAEHIESIVLRAQIQIESTRRRYTPAEQARLVDLFGEPDRWSRTLGRMLWTHATTVVGPFTAQTTADLPVPCTFDFTVAATKYFAGLDEGEIPLVVQFSGTVFYLTAKGLQVSIIPWDREARFRLPVATWREMIDVHYPHCAWLRLGKETFDRLHAYKLRHGLATWEQALERLLAAEGPVAPAPSPAALLQDRLSAWKN